MDICHREHLHQVDLLSPAEKKLQTESIVQSTPDRKNWTL